MIRLAILLLALVPALPAFAQQSAYTPLVLGDCEAVAPDPDDPLESGEWHCTGYEDIPVLVYEGDLRTMVSLGDSAADEVAASQTLPQFNSIGETLEWRLGADRRPYATILRYFPAKEDGQSTGQVLVVMRYGGTGGVCHVAYVDAELNPNANELARQAADERASGFDCAGDVAEWVGAHAD